MTCILTEIARRDNTWFFVDDFGETTSANDDELRCVLMSYGVNQLDAYLIVDQLKRIL